MQNEKSKKRPMGRPSGFRDLLPVDAIFKQWLVETIAGVYKRYGFLPIETPMVEFYETLVGEVTDFNLYKVSPSKERQAGVASELALRFDQTVPLARFMVDNAGKITLPFKRYVYGPVFRGETPQAGRYRQFDQFDIDIVGSSNIASDIEVLLCMRDTMRAILGDGKFIIRTNTRKLLNCLPALFAFSESDLRAVLIQLDKRDKITPEALLASLVEIGLSKVAADKLVEFCNISGNPTDVLSKIKNVCGELAEAIEPISDLQITANTLNECGATEILFDMSIIRGLGYYTGMVFETTLVDAPQFGSVYSGGRYDELVASFGVQPLPAVGASLGVDRLITALQVLDFQIPKQEKKVVVLIQDSAVISYAFKVANILRTKNIVCEVYTGGKKKLSDQFGYADALNYDYTIVVGKEEMEKGVINLKNQKTREQQNAISLQSFLDVF